MARIELRNESPNQFTDISSEKYRTYIYLREVGEGKELRTYRYRIENPQYLSVSESGGHRVLDADGMCRYISPGWIAIEWEPIPNAPHFVK